MRMLAGVMRPDGGAHRRSTASMSSPIPKSAKQHVSYMPQRFGLYEDLTVDENIRFYADLFEVPRALRARARRAACSRHPA